MAKKTGTKEWAVKNINNQRGCEYGCRYCYARYNAVHRFQCETELEWLRPVINTRAVHRKHSKYPGVVMFPSTHDITPRNITEAVRTIDNLLEAGNDLLIVSKPNFHCIETICNTITKTQRKQQVMFRFTIGSANPAVLSFWEPGAPTFTERLACLQYAYDLGFNTSVSCEPFLDMFPETVYSLTKPYISDSFWFGKLRHFNSRVSLAYLDDDDMKRVNVLKQLQDDDIVMTMVNNLKDCQFVKFKYSVREVIERQKK